MLRDLKRLYHYSIVEQEGMLPFERDLLLDMLARENLKDQDVPEQGWKKYAEEIGASKPWKYTDKFRAHDY